MIDLSTGATMAGLSQLVAKRILRDVGGGMEFINELVRAQVYGAIPSTIRTALHAVVADRMLKGNERVGGLELAWHLIRSGRPAEGTLHLLSGAREATRGGAPDEALLALRSGLDSISFTHKGEAQLQLAEVLLETGQWRDLDEVISDEAI